MTDARQPAWTPPPPYGYPGVGQRSGKAVTSLVLGIASLVLCGLLLGIPAMIVARQAKREIRESGGQLQGEGMATAGFWTGLVATALSLLVVAVFLFGGVVSGSFQQTCTRVGSGQGGTSTSCS